MKKAYFSKKLVEWYWEHLRDLPWRNTQDAYKIWLSEIILQQTRVVQGLPYYEKFIQHYPNINSLAEAKEQEVLRLWQGLGYYTRARNLHKCAGEVVKNYSGKFPQTFQELKKLPGIGDYTAAAIASFAFSVPVAVVDGNVYRVLSRIFGIEKNIASPDGKRFFFTLANELIPNGEPGTYNQAIMEFGARHCLPQNPRCDECMFSKRCVAFQEGSVERLPVKIKELKKRKRYFNYFIVRIGQRILMTKRTGKDIWKGLFDFPHLETTRNIRPQKILKKFPLECISHVSSDYKHLLTHQLIHARFIEVKLPAGRKPPTSSFFSNARLYSVKQIEKAPKPRLIARYLEDRGIL